MKEETDRNAHDRPGKAMNLADLLENAGGSESINKLAAQLGLDRSAAGKLIGALSPALLQGMRQQTESPESRA